MSDVISKQVVLDNLETMPDQIQVEALLNRIRLLAKIEEGIKAGQEGKLVPHSEIQKMVDRWFE